MTQVVRLDVGRKAGRGGFNAGEVEVGLEGIRALGFDHGRYYYLSPLTQQIVELTAADHTEANLCQLRELAWWIDRYPPVGKMRTRFDVSKARDDLMHACHRVGPFAADLVRGRGVWWDPKRGAIVHQGQWVHNGKESWRPSEAPFDHIYEASGDWPSLTGEPLDDDEALELLRLCERLRWAMPACARLLAGWLVVAPVCGALRWRPHIALTGPSQSGKSFVTREIIVPALGPLGLFVEGETTSAGIRQTLRRDARPIVWDEAEPQGAKGAARIQDALAFARSLSTADGGKVIKGGANHQASAFSGVGAMCIVSIFAQAMREADANRFTVLELQSRKGAVDAAADMAMRRALERLDSAFARGLFARTVASLGSLRQSHATFATAIAARWGSLRLGDQLGALLAGAWLLGSTEPITAEDAAAQVAELPDQLGYTPLGLSDEERCLQRLTTWWTRVDTAGGKRQVTRTVGELVELVLRNGGDADEIDPAHANKVLLRHGVRVNRDQAEIAVANHHDRLLDIYRDTDFGGGWSRLLERLPDARKSSAAVRFGPGAQARATVLPAALFTGEVGA